MLICKDDIFRLANDNHIEKLEIYNNNLDLCCEWI